MDNPELDEVLATLTLAAGALVAIVGSGRAKEADKVTFTGDFAALGEVSIKEVLDATDAALGKARAAL